jgi:hypothetical protein
MRTISASSHSSPPAHETRRATRRHNGTDLLSAGRRLRHCRTVTKSPFLRRMNQRAGLHIAQSGRSALQTGHHNQWKMQSADVRRGHAPSRRADRDHSILAASRTKLVRSIVEWRLTHYLVAERNPRHPRKSVTDVTTSKPCACAAVGVGARPPIRQCQRDIDHGGGVCAPRYLRRARRPCTPVRS